jgi:hypothetical protein
MININLSSILDGNVMLLKKKVYFLIALILIAGFIYGAQASQTNTVSFSSAGVTINSTFPEEAHPSEVVSHNVTITSTSPVTLRSVTIVVKAQQGQSWQEIYNGTDTISQPLPKIYNLQITLPQWVNGRLYCSILVRTTNVGDLSTTFYSTAVGEVTFSEIQILYSEILANYSSLKSDNSALLSQYNKLLANCSSLLADYDTLVTQHGSLRSEYESLRSEYNQLNQTYRNETDGMRQTISASENALIIGKIVIAVLVVAVTVLVLSTVYAKRKARAPYVVVNEETVGFRSSTH